LGTIVQQISRLLGAAGGAAMIETSALILALVSVGIFLAHALDAYRTG
jgi:Flp pilus assembly pilin Flp